MTTLDEAQKELFAAYDALREPPWDQHDMKMVRLYAAIDALRAATPTQPTSGTETVVLDELEGWPLYIHNDGQIICNQAPRRCNRFFVDHIGKSHIKFSDLKWALNAHIEYHKRHKVPDDEH